MKQLRLNGQDIHGWFIVKARKPHGCNMVDAVIEEVLKRNV